MVRQCVACGLMISTWWLISSLSSSLAQDTAKDLNKAAQAAQPANATSSRLVEREARFTDADVAALAARIDEHIARRWREVGVQPAAVADDSEFVRRVYLDLIGRIPHVAEAREFLADQSPGTRQADKRQALVRRLLDSPSYVAHWTNVWRNVYLPEVETDFQFRFYAPSFDNWLRKQLLEDRTYSEWVGELLTASIDQQRRFTPYGQGGEPSPMAFYQIKENKPENIAASVARVCLGVRIECAQCHNHPFAKWKREDFWSMAAFFKGTENANRGGVEGFLQDLFTFPEIAIPGSKKVVQARFIDGSKPHFKGKISFRQTLADWVTSVNNPYFAKATVNRLWGQLFGRGLVDPVDDFDAQNNPPSHPELLNDLAEEFAKHEYDLKFVLSAMTASRTYQLTSRQTHQSQAEPRLFARASVRGLTDEQLYDSVATATGYRDPNGQVNPFVIGGNSPRSDFLEKFKAGAENPSDRKTSIVQALTLMNGQLTNEATSLNRSETLAAVLDFPLFSTADRVEAIYLAALTRKPSAKELDKFVKYVDAGGPRKNSRDALADVFWALLNSSEFMVNH
jgi:Protein of unknown function (DUF1549)/Protein of unknown function (DUF1553)